jgi:hypothetical protein
MTDVLDGLSITVMIGSVGRPGTGQHQWTGLCASRMFGVIFSFEMCRRHDPILSVLYEFLYGVHILTSSEELHQVITHRFFDTCPYA